MGSGGGWRGEPKGTRRVHRGCRGTVGTVGTIGLRADPWGVNGASGVHGGQWGSMWSHRIVGLWEAVADC